MGLYSQSCHEFEAKTTTLHRQHYSLSFFSIVNVDRHHQPVIGCKQCVIFICQGIFWHIKISHSHSHVMIPIPNPVPIRSSKSLPILMGFPGESNPHGNSHSHEHLLHVIYFFSAGRVVIQFLLQTTSVPGAPFGAGNTLAFLVNNGSLLIPVQVQGMDYFELNVNCRGPNIFLWTGMLLFTGSNTKCLYSISLNQCDYFVSQFLPHACL